MEVLADSQNSGERNRYIVFVYVSFMHVSYLYAVYIRLVLSENQSTPINSFIQLPCLPHQHELYQQFTTEATKEGKKIHPLTILIS